MGDRGIMGPRFLVWFRSRALLVVGFVTFKGYS